MKEWFENRVFLEIVNFQEYFILKRRLLWKI